MSRLPSGRVKDIHDDVFHFADTAKYGFSGVGNVLFVIYFPLRVFLLRFDLRTDLLFLPALRDFFPF